MSGRRNRTRHTASAIAEAFSRQEPAALDAWERVMP